VTAERRGPRLPVDDVLDEVTAACRDVGRVVLQAPPGAGKTTRVPLVLSGEGWVGGGRIVVLEPRRLAARAAARRMASIVGTPVGREVGVVTRDDRRVSEATRIEVVTEGVLVRRLQRDPVLGGVAAVVFDEFHERSLDADLGLALSLEVADALRDDLRLVVMSATLDGARVADLLGGAPVVSSTGRAFDVDTVHLEHRLGDPLAPAVADAVTRALDAVDGDVLVFLPGAREIRQAERALDGRLPGGVAVTPLYGALPPDEQDRAIAPAPAGTRKVVLATDIAETSITIEGVRAVVDSGLARVPRFDPRSGMSRLETVRVSRASAEQRRGRAGRVAPGVCLRLWPEREHAGLDPFREPEIAQADLAGFALEVAAWGAEPSELRLLDAPPAAPLAQATDLLRALEAIDDDGRVTDHGRAVAALPVHPRLGHMLVRADERGLGGLACDVAALLADRDVLLVDRGTSVADLGARVRLLRGAAPPAGTRVRRGALARARRERQRLRRALRPGADGDPEETGTVLALAYPDRVAQRRAGARGRFLLVNGRGATLWEDDRLAGEDLLVVADVDRGERDARIWLAAALDEDRLRDVLAHRLDSERVVAWDDDAGDVVAERRETLGALVLARAPLPPGDADPVPALLAGIRARGLDVLPWDRDARDLRARIAFLHRTLDGGWPDVSDEALLTGLQGWLAPFLSGARRRRDLDRVELVQALTTLVGWDRAADLDRLAPTHLEVPSGSRVRLDYHDEGGIPVLPVKLQEMFGATRTPAVAGGRVPVVVHLLSPARRPVQVTQDLAGFWERGYPEVRAELRGRYPKHPWPEDPTSATPTRHTRRRAR
jgi:ATP-dependent helicase HrpB